MSTNKLSLEQVAIIKQLTDEFAKLNNTISIPTGLIDVNEIMDSSRLEKEFRDECNMANNAYKKLKIDAMLKDMETIKGDLAILNLAVRRTYNNSESFEIYPTHKPYDQLKYYHKLRVEYKDTHHYEKTFKGITIRIDCKYGVTIEINQITKTKPLPFDEFIQSSSFRDKLKTLYEETIK